MSVQVNRKEVAASELAVFANEEPVEVNDVPTALSALWRLASEQLHAGQEGALALAQLWNLVAYHANPSKQIGDSGGEADRIRALLERVCVSVPARVMHLEEWRDVAPPEPGKDVEAWVNTNCLLPPTGERMVCCETVNLAGYGEAGHAHFPALVRAMLVPDLPVALLWLDDMPRKGRVLGQLLQMSDRVIVDSQHTTDPAHLLAVNDLLGLTARRVVDLGWMRLKPLRHLVADLFEPPGRADQLARIERILIETSPEGRNTGLLLLGWLLSRCGYTEVSAVDLGPGADTHRWSVRRGDARSFPVDFQVREGYGGLDGIFCIALEAGGDTFALHDVDPEHMSLEGPDRKLPSVALRETDDPGLVAEALGGGRPDRVYADALAMASKLVATEQWMR